MITVEDDEGVARLWLSHGKANLLDLELCETFSERLDELAEAIHPSRYVRGSDILDIFGR